MIWLTWRQFRMPAMITFGALAILAILLGATGPHLHQVYQEFAKSIAACHSSPDFCSVSSPKVGMLTKFLENQLLLLLIPVLLGAFWGAPLICRELESGTWRLAWTQGVTRTRWLAVKLAIVGFAAVAATGLLVLMETLWSAPIDQLDMNRFDSSGFGLRGIVPMAYALFAFTFAVAAGVVLRRTLPAIAATAVAFLGARLGVTYGLRSHFLAAKHLASSVGDRRIGLEVRNGVVHIIGNPPRLPNSWVLSSSIVDSSGKQPSTSFIEAHCPDLAHPMINGGGTTRVKAAQGEETRVDQCSRAVAKSFHQLTAYHPAGRYWTFQLMETGFFVLLSVALITMTFWWVRKRIS